MCQTGCRVINRLIEIHWPTGCNELTDSLLADDTFRQLITGEYGNYVVQKIMEWIPDYRLCVLELIVVNFEQQAAGHYQYIAADDRYCFYAANFYGRHTVQSCLSRPSNFCEGWTDQIAVLVDLVLEQNGTPKREFQCLNSRDTRDMMQQIQELAQNGYVAAPLRNHRERRQCAYPGSVPRGTA